MANLLLIGVVALLGLCGAAVGEENSILHVTRPLVLQGAYQHSEALFGRPLYGGSITGVLVYATAASNHTGCQPITRDPSWPVDPIVLVDRGECDFVQKVRNAEFAGAQAVIIADDKPLCGPPSLGGSPGCPACEFCYNSGCECRLPFLADDGSGGDIRIPSALISKYDADRFKNCLAGTSPCTTKQAIVITLEWSLPTANVIDWDFWTTANNGNSATFRHDFVRWVTAFGASVQFEPHYFIYDGRLWDCTAQFANGQYVCGDQCTNQGRYCSPDPDKMGSGIAGADIVKENLRQMCIFQQANTTYATDFATRWWTYVAGFEAACTGSSFASDECSANQQRLAGLDPAITNACMANSGGLGDNDDNTMLKKEMDLREDLSIVLMPTIVINGVIERGAATAADVAQTLCQGFSANHAPRACSCLTAATQEELDDCLKGEPATPPTPTVVEEGVPGWVVVLLVIGMLLFVSAVVVVAVVLYRRQRRTMRNEMRDLIREYMPLGDGDGAGGGHLDHNAADADDGDGIRLTSIQPSA